MDNKTDSKDVAAEAQLTPFKLKQAHTHAGIEYQAGDTIHLDPADLRWAMDNGIGEPGLIDPAIATKDSHSFSTGEENKTGETQQ